MNLYTKLVLAMLAGLLFTSQAMAIKKDFIGDVEFKQVNMQDAVRILSELSGRNVIVTKDAADNEFSLFIRNASLVDAIDSMCRVTGLWYRKDAETGVYIVMTAEQFKADVQVYRNETTRIFTLKHQNVVSAANAIQALFGGRVLLQSPQNDGSYQFDGDMGTGGAGSNSSNNQQGNSRNRNTRNLLNNLSGGQTPTNINELSGEVQSLSNELTLSALERLGGRTTLKESDAIGLVQAAPIRVTYNSLHNLLLVRSSDEKVLTDVEKLIEQIDRPAKQVLLQMKIMRVALGENEESVFDFQYTTNANALGPQSNSIGNPLGGNNIPERVFGLGMKPDALATGSLVFQIANDNWLAKLAFLESENRTKLVSTPLIMASNNKEAEIFIGEERPLVENVSSSGGTVSDGVIQPLVVTTETSKKEVGTKLKIWPRINSDATVTLDIEQEISSINIGAATIPVATGGSNLEEYSIDTFTTTQLTLTAIAKHGQTIAVGGLIEENKGDELRKIPGVSNVPIIGDLLSSDENSFSRSELVILIKPFIYDSGNLQSESLAEIGTELQLDDNKDMIKQEIQKSKNFKKISTIESQSQLQSVAKTLQSLLVNRAAFQRGLGVDWQQKQLMISSLGQVQQGGFYYTRVAVTNSDTKAAVTLNDRILGDYWFGQAWVFAPHEIEAEIAPTQSRTAVLVSKQPVEEILTREGVPMRYVMSAKQQ